MNRHLIVTDYTRFKAGNPNVCVAGIDYSTGECVRPYPYLTYETAIQLGVAPGVILHGDFERIVGQSGPHQEDSHYSNLQNNGATYSSVFRDVLLRRSFDSVRSAFNLDDHFNGRGIPVVHTLGHSIASIKVEPSTLELIQDGFGKLRLNFIDQVGERWDGFPITDLGFFDYAQQHQTRGALGVINTWMQGQSDAILRIGLGRAFQPSGQPNAYWMQANGIYTFPDAPPGIRRHA